MSDRDQNEVNRKPSQESFPPVLGRSIIGSEEQIDLSGCPRGLIAKNGQERSHRIETNANDMFPC